MSSISSNPSEDITDQLTLARQEAQRANEILNLLQSTSSAITSQVELEKLVQLVTDKATEISGAQFGAFFYNVISAKGERMMLYTISGVPKEHFTKFPMPRNTEIFSPTFAGKGSVRYDDVTKQSHYGHNSPHKGMPEGHLPVKSYLAVPVISPIDNEVIGGLFFGHSEPAVFTEYAQKAVEGIALQGAIAMGNARLFEERNRAFQQLQSQKDQFESIYQSSSDGIMICDLEGTIKKANEPTEKMHGYSEEELKAVGMKKIIHPQYNKQFEGFLKDPFDGKKISFQAKHITSQGDSIDLDVSAKIFTYEGSLHILSVLRDVTEKNRAEKTIRETAFFAETIARTSPAILYLADEQGNLKYMNHLWEEWTGVKPEPMNSNWVQGVVEEDRGILLNLFAKSAENRSSLESDFRISDRDGELRWCTTRTTPIFDENGVYQGFAGSAIDISRRKSAEELAASQNLIIKTITDNTDQALFLMDSNQVCTFMNPAAEKMTGYKTHQVNDKPLHFYIHHTHPDGSHFPLEDCPIDRALPERAKMMGEEVFVHPDGHFYPVKFIASPIVENEIPIGTVIEAYDSTEEKRIQKELRQKEAETKQILELKVRERTAELEKINFELLQFTSVASHDLKEPLRKITLFCDRLSETSTNLNDNERKYLNTIVDSSKRMTSLIEDLLHFSRLTNLNSSYEVVDLNLIIKEVLHDLEHRIAESNAAINVGHLPVIHGIPTQLGQIFQNLISNSIKFRSPDRPLVIEIHSEKNGMYYNITYQDNGIGFNNEFADKIFDIFQRLHTRDQFEGTGIGLAIVKKIVAMHGGIISAKGEEGQGARFEMTLPA